MDSDTKPRVGWGMAAAMALFTLCAIIVPASSGESRSLDRKVKRLLAQNAKKEKLVKEFAGIVRKARGPAQFRFSFASIFWMLVAFIPGMFLLGPPDHQPSDVVTLAIISTIGILGGLLNTVTSALSNVLSFQNPLHVNARRFQLALVCISGALIIICFAIIFYTVSEVGTDGKIVNGTESFEFETALYFSITTLTSTGYGDWTPTGVLRFFANAEMITGYLLLGSFISALVSHLSHRQREPDFIPLLEHAMERAAISEDERESILTFIDEGFRQSGAPLPRGDISSTLRARRNR